MLCFQLKKDNFDYKVHILLQGSKTPVNETTDSESVASTSQEKPSGSEESVTSTPTKTVLSTPTVQSSSGIYSCHACPFTTSRLNVMILHNKSHSVTFTPYTPSPISKKSIVKAPPKSTPKSSSSISKTSKVRKPKNKGSDYKKIFPSKRKVDENSTDTIVKKTKTDEEIKSSLLADWDDMEDESPEEEEQMPLRNSPKIPAPSESPAMPVSEDSIPDTTEIIKDTSETLRHASETLKDASDTKKTRDNKNEISEKPDCSSDSRYEFCEDEDWPLEADVGRKIPRVKNASKQKSDSHRRSLDENEVAKEVAELLDKTTVPELPSAPEPLKVEENFPEPTVAKSPDKSKLPSNENGKSTGKTDGIQTKTIFKTKTFFRSRHSRSQDVIGKYVAEQLNAAEKLDLLENDINGSDTTSSPDARDSPPIEHVKVARLAPKIQLKKMKAEAAQLMEKSILESNHEVTPPLVDAVDKEQSDQIIDTNKDTLSLESTKESLSFPNTEIPEDKILLSTTSNVDEVSNTEDNIQTDKENCENNVCDNSVNHNIMHDNENLREININESNNEEKMNKNESDIMHNNDNDSLSNTVESPNEIPEQQNMDCPITQTDVNTFLSVSRDTDRVTKVISNDPPEDLFEDDNKGDNMMNLKDNHNGLGALDDNRLSELSSKQDCIVAEKHEEKKQMPDNDELMKIDSHTTSIIEDTTNEDNAVSVQNNSQPFIDNIPTESDLQIAEALINLPSTGTKKIINKGIQLNTNIQLTDSNIKTTDEGLQKTDFIRSDHTLPMDVVINESKTEINSPMDNFTDDPGKTRYETEEEKSENLNAAQSLVQMSETLDHKLATVSENSPINEVKQTVPIEGTSANYEEVIAESNNLEQKLTKVTDSSNASAISIKSAKPIETIGSSKLLQILEEPCAPKSLNPRVTASKSLIIPGKEKIINFDVSKSPTKNPNQSKQKIIIRRTTPTKNVINNLNEPTQEKIVLSRTKPAQDGSSVQTYTIQASPNTHSDANTIIITQNIKKVNKTPQKLQTYKPQSSSSAHEKKSNVSDEGLFDINSMPIVLSDDIITPENIEKMPMVMSDGNIITNPTKTVKNKQVLNEKDKKSNAGTMINKPEMKTLLINAVPEVSKVSTPNILSKSSKLRTSKPMFIIDKMTGKQKIIMTKSEPMKEVKQSSLKTQPIGQAPAKTEKFIILPAANAPRPNRTQKIVIDPQTGKAHVLVTKSSETLNMTDNKPVSAKLIPSVSEAGAPGGTVMIITNAQGAQSRIVLTPEHEKILFPNKQQPNLTHIKTVSQRQVVNAGNTQKQTQKQTIVTTLPQTVLSKQQTKLVPKQKNTIITSKGQLIVGGRLAAAPTTPALAPMPEIRPAPSKRIVTADPTKITQTIQKSTPGEPLIFLQQKSGTIMQLTAAQFEHLQRTGQIVQKTQVQPVVQDKLIIQKSLTLTSNEPAVPIIQKQKTKTIKQRISSPVPPKKLKQEINIAPAPASQIVALPALAPLPTTNTHSIISAPVPTPSQESYSELENLEELLPSTAIARQPEALIQPQPQTEPAPPALSDGQLLAVPGEHFGGPPGSFYLCVEDNGTLTPIDNRPLVLENNQLVPMAIEPVPLLAAQPERRDILEAALANSDVFHAEPTRDDAPDFRDLNVNVSVHCRVSETSTTLNQPIMTPIEMPTKGDSEPTVPANLEDGLAVIGVTPQTVPTSLELPITVTDPRIAPKTTDPLSNITYGTTLLPSPNTEMAYVPMDAGESAGPISMPLLTDDDGIGKSMPILTDEANERTASSVDSTVGSPSSIEVRESEVEEGSNWSHRLLTPGSDSSETSAEIPLQPAIQVSVNDLHRNS